MRETEKRNFQRPHLVLMDTVSKTLTRLRPLMSSGLTLVAGRLIPIFVGLVSFPLLTRILGPDQYGQLSLINSLVGLTSTFSITWIGSAVQRYYANDMRTYGQATLNRYIYLRALPVSTALALSGLGILFWIYPVEAILIVAAIILVASQMLYSVGGAIFQAMLRFRALLLIEFAKALTYVAMLMLFIHGLHLGVAGALWAAALSGITALFFLTDRKGAGGNQTEPGPGYLKKFVSYGLPMTVSNVAAWVLQLSDRWFLVSYNGDAAVGTYAASYSLIDYIVRTPMQMLLLFVSLQLFRIKNFDEALARFTSLRPFVLVAITTFVGLAITIGDPLLSFMVNSNYYISNFTIYKIVRPHFSKYQ